MFRMVNMLRIIHMINISNTLRILPMPNMLRILRKERWKGFSANALDPNRKWWGFSNDGSKLGKGCDAVLGSLIRNACQL